MSAADCDLALVGSGFGASILAMIARRLGLQVVLLERAQHPRFAIGESASPLAGAILEDLARQYDLPRLAPLAAYGPWRRTYPDVVCGLKRGFTYYRHDAGRRYRAASDRSNQLMVAASPCDEVADTHWLRSDVDYFLVREAIALGAEYLDRVQLEDLGWSAAGMPILSGHRDRRPFRLCARLVVDGSGPRGFLSRALQMAEGSFTAYPGTQALFSHFTGVARCGDMPEYATNDVPPYPADDAALHHVFDDGWMWVLRFENGVTSAGVALTDRAAGALGLADGAAAWTRVLKRYPSIAAQFADAEPIRPFSWMPRLPYRAWRAVGDRWAMLPSAAAFVDPLFSTGIPLTLMGIERLARLLEYGWSAASLRQYGTVSFEDVDHTARFIAGCYAAFPRFEIFAAYSMFYFTAASYSEMARRLGRHDAVPRFLGAAHPAFAAAMTRSSPAESTAIPGSAAFGRQVAEAVDCLNVAGLCDPAKRNWYGVDLEETARHAAKLGVTADAIRSLAPPPPPFPVIS
jgi:tetracycline 7-halogenase / FADH2 O2-dependent halogenase